MQNIVIIGIIAITLVGGILFFSLNGSDQTMPETAMNNEADMATEDMIEAMVVQPDVVEPSVPTDDIVSTAANAPSLGTLVTAITAADLTQTLQGPGPFTVFAPTSDAFADLPAGTLDTLLLPENQEQLQDVLTYHVVSGAVLSSELTDGMEVTTLNGDTITINVSEAGVSINGSAMVTVPDIATSNGIVHIIDSVLLPPTE